GDAVWLPQTAGTPVPSMPPLTKLRWFAREDPGTAARVRTWVGLKDFVLLRLTGTLATELSSASGTGLLDVRARRWSEAALELAGVTPEQLPQFLPTTA